LELPVTISCLYNVAETSLMHSVVYVEVFKLKLLFLIASDRCYLKWNHLKLLTKN